MTPAPAAPRVGITEFIEQHISENGCPVLAYMMHPLGGGADRERNRQLACQWQATLQKEHGSKLIVLAPWIGLSGAWQEDMRELGMAVDKATIGACDIGIVTGVTTGPKNVGRFEGVSPGMAEELHFYADNWPNKPLFDVRGDFAISLPEPAKRHDFKPRFEVGDWVRVENKTDDCQIMAVEQTAPGQWRYQLRSVTLFFAYEQHIGGKV